LQFTTSVEVINAGGSEKIRRKQGMAGVAAVGESDQR